jgi:DNA-binding LytR/AlgR family response regulator
MWADSICCGSWPTGWAGTRYEFGSFVTQLLFEMRTHRSWLVNGGMVTALKPEGSGDYTVELGPQAVPLPRRFPDALAKLRGS